MKWLLTLLIFIAGIFYLVDQRKVETRQRLEVEQAKKEIIKATGETVLPLKTENPYLITFSLQTLKTLRMLTSDPSEKVRIAATELLWELQDEQAPPIIKKLFQEETEESVRLALINLLVKDKSKLSLALLATALDSYDKATRMKALEAIGTFSNKEAITVLSKGLVDYDEEIRLKALEAVNRIRRDRETNKEQLLREIKDTKPRFRIE